MLPNHAPLVVAERFGTLEALHPGRIDLGIGRAPGTDQRTMRALRRLGSSDDLLDLLHELYGFFNGFAPGDEYAGIHAVPGYGSGMPAIWLLGSSGYSAQAAGLMGLPFAFAHHFSAPNTLPALELYRSRFQESPDLEAPYAQMTVFRSSPTPTPRRSAWPRRWRSASPSAAAAGRRRRFRRSGRSSRTPGPTTSAPTPTPTCVRRSSAAPRPCATRLDAARGRDGRPTR